MGDKRIKLGIESDIENVSLVGMITNQLCASISLSDADIYQIELCVVEAVTNCIKHAYQREPGRPVEIAFTISGDKIVIDISDEGKAMDEQLLHQACLSLQTSSQDNIEEIAEGGRGLGIIKEIMDGVEYVTKKRVNTLSMSKRLNFNQNDD